MDRKSSSTNSYKDTAGTTFAALLARYAETDAASSYWKLGNTFDTMVDYLDVFDNSKANILAKYVVKRLCCTNKLRA